ncbi:MULTISPECIES: DNA uptake porin HofQ [Rahnella]|jgi:protein transport protein HofQ|uniref:DNA uptake porin HofQ n=1 Tax=Rahnella TaxID=34037 RepID=UPI000DD439CC|nr:MULTISPECIES: DNA uptake porin HofQ [Rahnella]AYA05262.1 DNA uptake porin HofQ [Rahnella aquatilis]AZP49238.1 DNA uptake porin HofQ [Rahnella aquatilis]MBU9842516.1 DNA uptake porin HofQ [Rahnella aceris]MBU9868635.1 DNA uptake porin HofQ [Rahnella aceris]MDP9705975.1 protein transport protein HofQ [Rahnella aquatilis]
MKYVNKRIVLFLLCLCLSPVKAGTPPLISLEFQSSPVGLVLQALADARQLNLVTAPGLDGQISVKLKDVPWQQALDIILQMNHLTSQLQGNVLLVSPEEDPQVVQQRIKDAADQQALQSPLISLTVPLQYADAKETALSLNAQKGSLLSQKGNASADTRTNTLLLRDTQAALDVVAPWVKEMDLPLQQVQLAAHIVTMNSESLRELGVRWGFTGEEPITKAVRMNNFSMGMPVENPIFTAGFNLAHISGRILDLELTALEQEDKVDIIASPRLLTAHMQTASIKQGTEIPYQVSSGASGSTSIEFKEAVLGMEVMPKIQRDGRIQLALQISQNMPGRSIKQSEGEALAIDKQEIKTQVTVKNGETIVLGGIFQRKNQKTDTKVPVLGDIPVVGSLFKHQYTNEQRRELVIFITPTLILTR